jgi:hypothetical protein
MSASSGNAATRLELFGDFGQHADDRLARDRRFPGDYRLPDQTGGGWTVSRFLSKLRRQTNEDGGSGKPVQLNRYGLASSRWNPCDVGAVGFGGPVNATLVGRGLANMSSGCSEIASARILHSAKSQRHRTGTENSGKDPGNKDLGHFGPAAVCHSPAFTSPGSD